LLLRAPPAKSVPTGQSIPSRRRSKSQARNSKHICAL
jgi:hypothetical protein